MTTDDTTPAPSPYPDQSHPPDQSAAPAPSPYPDQSHSAGASPYPDVQATPANARVASADEPTARPVRQPRQPRQARQGRPARQREGALVPAGGASSGWLDEAPRPAPGGRRSRAMAPVPVGDDVPPWYEDDYFAYDDWGDLPKQSSTFRRVVLFLIGFGLIVALSGSFVYRWYERQLDPDGPAGTEVVLEIPKGATAADIARILADDGVVKTGYLFRWWLGRQENDVFQAGTYKLASNMSYEEAYVVLGDGPVNQVGELAVTIPPGLRTDQVVAAIMESGVPYDEAELADAVERARRPAVLGTGLILTSEGFLFPDTYNVQDNDVVEEAFVERLVDQFESVVLEVDLADSEDLVGYSPYEVLTVASMIEREAGLPPEERAQIARVIYNRLEIGQKLQIDATTVYAWSLEGQNKTQLTERDLELESPYNTYFVDGLPQGPIAGVSRASLEAALNPAEGDWLYYVRTDENGEFSHAFAVTDAEFLEKKAICEEKGFC